MKTLPRLFLGGSSNVRFWEIRVVKSGNKYYLQTEYGTIKGKSIVSELKSPSPSKEKALEKAKTEWTNKKHQGYSETMEIKRPPAPMKAMDLEAGRLRIKYPAVVQPKIDGLRLWTHWDKKTNKPFFESRQGKPYPKEFKNYLPEIYDEFNLLFNKNPKLKTWYLDGELVQFNTPPTKLRGFIVRELTNQLKNTKVIIFDGVNTLNPNQSFKSRFDELTKIFKNKTVINKMKNIELILTEKVNNWDEIQTKFEEYLETGFEGIVVRNLNAPYIYGKGSYDVLRSKPIFHQEFEIKGFIEGSGADKGTVIWILSCLNDPKRSFRARPMGTREQRKKAFKMADKFIGKKILVKYYQIDKDGCVVRFPVAILTPEFYS